MLRRLADLVVLLLNLGLGRLRELQTVLCQERVAEAERKRGSGQVNVHERAGVLTLIPLPEAGHAPPGWILLLLLSGALVGAWCLALAPVDSRRRDRHHMAAASGI